MITVLIYLAVIVLGLIALPLLINFIVWLGFVILSLILFVLGVTFSIYDGIKKLFRKKSYGY